LRELRHRAPELINLRVEVLAGPLLAGPVSNSTIAPIDLRRELARSRASQRDLARYSPRPRDDDTK
jgi:hypothetical protein